MRNHTFRRVVAETNIFDSAIGFAVAVAFVKVVNMFVTYILTPPVRALVRGKHLANFEFTFRFFQGEEPVLFRYGMFLDSLVQFIMVAFVVYWVARVVVRIKRSGVELIQRLKVCSICYMKIPSQAKKCPYCQSEI